MEAQIQEVQQVFLGIDIGGTNNKIAILSKNKIDVEATHYLTVIIGDQKYHLYAYSVFNIQLFLQYLRQLKTKVKSIRVVATGGGAVQYAKPISDILQKQVPPISEFEAHGRGLQLYKETGLQLNCVQLQREQNMQINIKEISLNFQECKNLLFVSLGSGVNYQLYGQTENGFNRKTAKDKLLTTGDGFFLEGTSLGAGFLMGLGRLWAGQESFKQLLNLMKEQSQLKQYYEAILINIFLIGINMALLHDQNIIFLSGALLSYQIDISTLFKRAIQYLAKPQILSLKVVSLKSLQGYLGAFGALRTALSSIND